MRSNRLLSHAPLVVGATALLAAAVTVGAAVGPATGAVGAADPGWVLVSAAGQRSDEAARASGATLIVDYSRSWMGGTDTTVVSPGGGEWRTFRMGVDWWDVSWGLRDDRGVETTYWPIAAPASIARYPRVVDAEYVSDPGHGPATTVPSLLLPPEPTGATTVERGTGTVTVSWSEGSGTPADPRRPVHVTLVPDPADASGTAYLLRQVLFDMPDPSTRTGPVLRSVTYGSPGAVTSGMNGWSDLSLPRTYLTRAGRAETATRTAAAAVAAAVRATSLAGPRLPSRAAVVTRLRSELRLTGAVPVARPDGAAVVDTNRYSGRRTTWSITVSPGRAVSLRKATAAVPLVPAPAGWPL